jgi:hypothetical protein
MTGFPEMYIYPLVDDHEFAVGFIVKNSKVLIEYVAKSIPGLYNNGIVTEEYTCDDMYTDIVLYRDNILDTKLSCFDVGNGKVLVGMILEVNKLINVNTISEFQTEIKNEFQKLPRELMDMF